MVLALAVAGCTQSGNLVEISVAPPTLRATHYEVFWLDPAAKLQGSLCNSYLGEIDQSAHYFARIADAELAATPSALPLDYQSNAISLMVENSRPVRAVVVYLTTGAKLGTYEVVGIGDSVTALPVSEDRVRRYALTVNAINPGEAEYIAPDPSSPVPTLYPAALRWHTSQKEELRVSAFADPIDFDGDGSAAVVGKNCPTKEVPSNGDCDDAAFGVHPQPDNTCGMQPDIDCTFNTATESICATAPENGFCDLGLHNCSDGLNGRCNSVRTGVFINEQAPACQNPMPEFKTVRCEVRYGLSCETSQFHPQSYTLATSTCSIWYTSGAPDIVVSRGTDGTNSAILQANTDNELGPCNFVFSLVDPLGLHSNNTKILAATDRKMPVATLTAFNFVPVPCDNVQKVAGVYCN